MLVYKNFLNAMKEEKVTFIKIGELLNCRYQTVSDIVNGNTKSGFYYDDAVAIQKKLLPKYSVEFLFTRTDVNDLSEL